MRIWLKKVLDSRFPIFVTRCEKRRKKILKLAVFGMQVTSLLIEVFATELTESAEKKRISENQGIRKRQNAREILAL